MSKKLDERYLIVLVGLNPKDIKSLPKNILAIPRTSDIRELAVLYTRAEAVLSLSKAETFGLTLVEGQACGTPSIGYNATAIKEIITDKTGLKVEPGNIDNVVNAVHRITQEKLFLPEICRQQVVENFNQDIQFSKYIDIYEKILNN